MRIAIIGAGWFGCHIGSELLNDGHQVKVFEREKGIFLGASGNNQNRLHLGYHYPRSYITREQSRRCFKKFKKFYPQFSSKIKNNFYCISEKKENMIDFETYLQILKASKLPFKTVKINRTPLKNINGIIRCPEEYVISKKAKTFFIKKFKNNIFFNSEIKNIKKKNGKFIINNFEFDFIINTTWQQFKPSKKWDLSYELCISLLYKCKRDTSLAITVMDGPFYTLYPWGDSIYNLYSVKFSRFKKTKKFASIKNYTNKINNNDLIKIKKKMEQEFLEYFPNFKKKFVFYKYIKTFRTLIDKKNHSRDYQLEFKNNIFNVLSGKIDHIFLASEDIKKCIKNYS
tara:strand:- start:2513 stop:3541 length:1029 start_codon:yes stop_codon:yes gene_type:complete